MRKGDEDDDDVGVRNEKRNRVRTRAIFGGDAMMMPSPDAGGVVSTNNAPEIERVEMLKQRNRSNVFDIADASSLSLAAPPAVLMSETPPEIESVAPNLMEEDSLNIATAPDVVVQSSIEDAMALIQAEEREAKIASGEIVGTLFRLFSFPFVAFFFLFARVCFFAFAAQTVDCDLGYTLGASQSTFLLCSYIDSRTASEAFDDWIFVSMDWRPEKRLNCRRGVSAYIFFSSFFGGIYSVALY